MRKGVLEIEPNSTSEQRNAIKDAQTSNSMRQRQRSSPSLSRTLMAKWMHTVKTTVTTLERRRSGGGAEHKEDQLSPT